MQRVTTASAWASLLCGLVAVWSLVSGYRRSFGLPDVPRPNVGPGFSESATAVFGGALIGWWFAAAGVLFALVAQIVGPRRLFKLTLSIPALLYFLAPFFLVR
jgi:hypothetical protein